MVPFVYDIPTRVYFGEGQLSHLHEEIEKYGKRVLLVYGGGSIKKNGVFDSIAAEAKKAGAELFELGGVEPNPRLTTVEKGTAFCREKGIDVLVAAGGGSAIDCAKHIASATLYDGEPWDLVEKRVFITEALPILAVGTMAATGTEMDPMAVISNEELHQKRAIRGSAIRPRAAFLDPTLTYSVPRYQTACGAADIFSHALETYFNREPMYMIDTILEGVLRTVVKFAPVALKKPDDYEARANLLWAAEWAINGLALSTQTCRWSCHPLEHQLSAYYDMTHGLGLAILTPRWMEFALTDDTAPKMKELGVRVFDLDPSLPVMDGAKAAIEAVRHFFVDTLGLASTLGELGIGEEHFDEMAVAAEADGTLNCYVPIDREAAKAIYKACL